MKQTKKGISLIVLVITIIVMIILAASIILSLSGNNVMEKAGQAKKQSNYANAKHVVTLAQADWELDEQKLSDKYNDSFGEYAESKLKEAGYMITDEITDENLKPGSYEVTDAGDVYVYPVIPEGFVASKISTEDEVSEGLVIYEMMSQDVASTNWDQTITVDGVSILRVHKIYNQFVWIPVNYMNEFARRDWGTSNIDFKTRLKEYSSEISAEAEEYATLKASVEKYSGFYIARYEAGVPTGKTLATVAKDGTDKPVSMKMATVWAGHAWDSESASGGSWENDGIAKVARQAYSTSTSVVSHLLYGSEWDAALRFISKTDSIYPTNSIGKGWYADNYSNNPTNMTGIDVEVDLDNDGTNEVGTNKLSNIYDMAGNVDEWTMEVDNSSEGQFNRVLRGGDTWHTDGSIVPASGKISDAPNATWSPLSGFRVALYLK